MTALRLNQPICKIDMTAFSAVMFVLFVAMIAMSPQACRCVGIDLPHVDYSSPMPGVDREDALIVAIMRDGKIFFGNDQVVREELGAKVAQRLISARERRIYVKADARARYRSVKAALDGIWAGGVQEVGILVEQRRALPR
jgi:biopolymer transport protein TolR